MFRNENSDICKKVFIYAILRYYIYHISDVSKC